jgi:hypothetical protein
MIVFMVNRGFSLLELRKLYVDELFSYYQSLIFVLEKKGEIQEGSYGRVSDQDDISELRRQLGNMKPR